MEKVKEKKKVIFSEEIDDQINGFSLAISFIIIGIFLGQKPLFFGSETITKWITFAILAFGILGLCVEVDKNIESLNIKGFNNIWMTALLIVIFGLGLKYFSNLGAKLILSFMEMIFLNVFIQGILQVVYSTVLYLNDLKKNEKGNRVKKTANLLEAVLKFLSIVLAFLQIILLLTGSSS